MAVTYPLDFPSVEVQTSSFRLMRSTALTQSPFTYSQQVYNWQGEMWEGEITFRPMKRVDASVIQAFLAKLRGQFGTFLYSDPDFLALGIQGTNNGTPLVNGASQTGNELITDGWAANETVLKAGDYIQLGTGSSSRLHMVVDDVLSDGSGNATINLEPAIRSSPANNAAIITTGAKGVFRLSENSIEWQADGSNVYSITLAFREALDGS